MPSGLTVTSYPVIVDPFVAPGVMFRVTLPSPGTATTAVGASGAPAGVTVELTLERVEFPTIFVATAVKV